MAKHFKLAVLFISLALIVLSGCASTSTRALSEDQRLLVHSNLNSGVLFESLIENVNNGGFTEVQLSGRNISNNVQKIEYKIDWFDSRGMEIKSILSRWNKKTLVNNMPFQIHAISPKADISSFKILIIRDDSSGS
ncbi:MAG: YcfL family protein [Desulfuromonas sp.]|nr:YcfL family protein [Desulfuromonas sp.]